MPSETLEKPKIYYKLDNFYANHRNFVKSLDYSQLRADSSSAGADCSPIKKNKDVSTPLNAVDGTTVLNPDDDANPCGLRAKYFFTDTFALSETGGSSIAIDETKISNSIDRNSKFKNSKDYQTKQYRNTEDEHLMVWYQTDAFPKFIKLWGKIDQNLEAGENYTMTISNTYDVEDIETQKAIYFSETNFFGGNNLTFGILYLIGGIVCIILAIVMVVFQLSKKKLGPKVATKPKR